MVASVVHAVIAAQDEKGGLQMVFDLDSFVDLLDYAVHFCLLRNHVGTAIRVNICWNFVIRRCITSWDLTCVQCDLAQGSA